MGEGYHFVDILLTDSGEISTFDSLHEISFAEASSAIKMKQFLSDFDQPSRLINVLEDDSAALNDEAVGELDVELKTIAAGGDSPFLPKCYKDLFEEGNIIEIM